MWTGVTVQTFISTYRFISQILLALWVHPKFPCNDSGSIIRPDREAALAAPRCFTMVCKLSLMLHQLHWKRGGASTAVDDQPKVSFGSGTTGTSGSSNVERSN